jgi:Ser/Thr protein kinase RdoA (MazF antagonist)
VNEEDISDVLSHYPVGDLKSFEKATGGMTNESWFIEASGRSYFLRNRNPSYQKDSIEFELCLVDRLAKTGFPVVAPLRTCEGSLFAESGGRRWELYERIDGEQFNPENLVQVRSSAKLLARFHVEGKKQIAAPCKSQEKASDRMRRLDQVWALIDRFESELRAESPMGKLLSRPLAMLFRDQAKSVVEGLQILSDDDMTLIHGDFQPSNVLFSGDEASVLLDFGDAGTFYRAYDLAKALLRFSALKPGYRSQMDLFPHLDLERMKEFTEAYLSEISSVTELLLSDEEIQAIPILLRGIYLYDTAFFLGKEKSRRKQAAILLRALRFIFWIDRNAEATINIVIAARGRHRFS